jgi:hypothetical protein
MLRYSKWLCVIIIGLVIACIEISVKAGPIWNLDGEQDLENKSREVSVSFFKAVGNIYQMFASLELARAKKEDFSTVKIFAEAANEQLNMAEDNCKQVVGIGKKDKTFQKRFYESIRIAFERKRDYEKLLAIPSKEEIVWSTIALPLKSEKLEDMLLLCSKSLAELRNDFAPLYKSINQGNQPALTDIWRLMNRLEMEMLRGRYISIILSSPKK